MKSTGEKIKRIRNSKGISQMAVAESCGIKQSSYANIENGKTQSISIEVGKGIAKKLNVAFTELFNIETIENEKQKEFTISVIANYILAELSHYTLLSKLTSNEKLPKKERMAYKQQKENIKQGIYKTFKEYKEQGKIDNEMLKQIIDRFPTFTLWQNLLESLHTLID